MEYRRVLWYRQAAKQGVAEAQCILGVCYIEGIGVTQDAKEAVRWISKSAKQGYAPAQCAMGYFYEAGLGVRKNRTEAIKWYRKAAAQGNKGAIERLRELGE